MTQPSLLFKMALPAKSQRSLVWGRLIFVTDKGQNLMFQATSGAPGGQYWGAWTVPRKGCLPPTSVIKQKYGVSTQRLWMPNNAGVGGSFYPIAPFSVRMGSVSRGDFGIHLDANYLTSPGSLGCIVLNLVPQYRQIEKLLDGLHAKRIKNVPLTVEYTKA